MAWVAGVDGFKSRWCLVLLHLGTREIKARIVEQFRDLLALPESPGVIAVDVPIGLPDFTPPGGRQCEREARRLLKKRASSVFSAVGRTCLGTSSRLAAHQVSRENGGIGIGAQAWGLAAKLREVDDVITPDLQTTIYEVHPELSFWALNQGMPMNHGKKTAPGFEERVRALVSHGFPHHHVRHLSGNLKVGRDDFIDACAAAWTAERIVSGIAGRLPGKVERDARGLDMAMWY
jgi:predicted RNase H-like nuclease